MCAFLTAQLDVVDPDVSVSISDVQLFFVFCSFFFVCFYLAAQFDVINSDVFVSIFDFNLFVFVHFVWCFLCAF